jgi:hypothetical protein
MEGKLTKLDKPVVRETHSLVYDRKTGKDLPVVVELDRTTITLRLKGLRSRRVTLALERLFTEKEQEAARRAAGLK